MNILVVVGIAVVVIFGILAVLLAFLLKHSRQSKECPESTIPYQAIPLLSPAEVQFLRVLEQCLPNQFRVFTKVRLSDLIRPGNGQDRGALQRQWNRITSKHVDFVLCDPKDFRVLGALELDDASHQKPDRQARDGFVDGALASAGILLLRIPAQRTYRPDELRQSIENQFLNPNAKPSPSPFPASLPA